MYVCVGCAIDVYWVCNSLEFDMHPDRPLVEAVARGEGLALARGLLRERSIEEVVRDSASIGYPVSRELASGG